MRWFLREKKKRHVQRREESLPCMIVTEKIMPLWGEGLQWDRKVNQRTRTFHGRVTRNVNQRRKGMGSMRTLRVRRRLLCLLVFCLQKKKRI